MTILKNKIKNISPLPNVIKKKVSPTKIISIILLFILIFITSYFIIVYSLPYINAVKIDKIAGKKIVYTDCNTKDYIIISKDKSYSLQLTDNNCKKNNYEGSITIKNNEIHFKYKENNITKEIIGIININDNYTISINNIKFEEDKNE